jgi:uncharacterized protein
MLGLLGVKPELDSLGGDLSRLCVVESDGSIGVSDVARICPPLSTDVLDVFESPLDAHASAYQVADIQEISDTCKRCRYRMPCGGGYLPHRFDGSSFRNPSLYCAALYSLADTMFDVLRADLPAKLVPDTMAGRAEPAP